MMSSRVRVEAALGHREGDRVPLDLGDGPCAPESTSARCTLYARRSASTHLAHRCGFTSHSRCSVRSRPICSTTSASTPSWSALPTNFFGLRNEIGSRGRPSTGPRCSFPASFRPNRNRTASCSCTPRVTGPLHRALACPHAGSSSTAITRQESLDDDVSTRPTT